MSRINKSTSCKTLKGKYKQNVPKIKNIMNIIYCFIGIMNYYYNNTVISSKTYIWVYICVSQEKYIIFIIYLLYHR